MKFEIGDLCAHETDLWERGMCAGKVRKHIHTEDAIKASDIHRLGQIHRVERHQTAQARFDQEIAASISISVTGAVIQSVPVRTLLSAIGQSILTHFGKAGANCRGRQTRQRRLGIYATLGHCNRGWQKICADNVNRAIFSSAGGGWRWTLTYAAILAGRLHVLCSASVRRACSAIAIGERIANGHGD